MVKAETLQFCFVTQYVYSAIVDTFLPGEWRREIITEPGAGYGFREALPTAASGS